MNKVVKVAGITAALAATLLLGGCNEEKKYNALKMEIVPVVEHYKKTTADWSEGVAKNTENLKKLQSEREEINKKLEEMKKLSKDDVNLSNDYLAVKRDVENHLGISESFLKDAIKRAERNKIK